MPITVLSIAGGDSSSGAGIQADLQTFQHFGVHGSCAFTCLTAQNPKRVLGVLEVPASFLQQQLEVIFSYYEVVAIKTGMLHQASIILALKAFLDTLEKQPPLVIDPVIRSTSGALLLSEDALSLLQSSLLPRATLITPNLMEAEALLNFSVKTPSDMQQACLSLFERFGCSVLLKGGHLEQSADAIDLYYDGDTFHEFSLPYLKGKTLRGSGCRLSAAIIANLAKGMPLKQSIHEAKTFLHQMLEGVS